MLRLVSQAKYLRVRISHQNFEQQSLSSTITTAKTACRRLARWLTSRDLHARVKIRIWQSSVLLVLIYGVFSAGLNYI